MAIPTRIHGFIDLALALVLLAFPWTLQVEPRGAESWIPLAAGALLLASSMLTDYEIGRLRRIQLPVHLWLDGLIGLLLAVSPWLFAFDRLVWVPHVVIGVALVAVAITSQTIPGYDRRAPTA
jgi:uncharacterized membrane protein